MTVVLLLLVASGSNVVFFFEQKTAYEVRFRVWSSDVFSSDLSQHENLRTAVLVDENLTRARFLGLRHQEIDDDRLAAPGRANDQRVANVALVKAEEVGAACARLHQRDRVPPMVPRGEASGIGME